MKKLQHHLRGIIDSLSGAIRLLHYSPCNSCEQNFIGPVKMTTPCSRGYCNGAASMKTSSGSNGYVRIFGTKVRLWRSTTLTLYHCRIMTIPRSCAVHAAITSGLTWGLLVALSASRRSMSVFSCAMDVAYSSEPAMSPAICEIKLGDGLITFMTLVFRTNAVKHGRFLSVGFTIRRVIPATMAARFLAVVG